MSDLGGRRFTLSAVIGSGESLSDAQHINNGALVGFFIPANWTAADITFAVGRTEAGAFAPMRDAEGTEVTITGFSAGDYIALPAGAFHGIEFLKIRSGAAGSPVNQGAERSVVLVIRAFQ